MSPQSLRRFHAIMTCLWAFMIVPAALWLRGSIPFLVAISVYANFAGHFSSWQGARAECAQDDNCT